MLNSRRDPTRSEAGGVFVLDGVDDSADDDDSAQDPLQACPTCDTYGWLCGLSGPADPPIASAALLLLMLLGRGRRARRESVR